MSKVARTSLGRLVKQVLAGQPTGRAGVHEAGERLDQHRPPQIGQRLRDGVQLIWHRGSSQVGQAYRYSYPTDWCGIPVPAGPTAEIDLGSALMTDNAGAADQRSDSESSPRGPRLQALKVFLHQEAVAGLALLVAAVAAMIWANSSAGDWYFEFWHRELTLGGVLGHYRGPAALGQRRVDGRLLLRRRAGDQARVGGRRAARAAGRGPAGLRRARRRRAAGADLRAAGARRRGPGGLGRADGHGHRLRGRRPGAARRPGRPGAKLLLLSIAIVDDIIAIVVIAVFYTDASNLGWLAVALGLLAVSR